MAEPQLFANQRETSLHSSIAMIEDVLVELGYFVNDSRENPGAALHSWRIKKGSAQVRIAICDRPDFAHVRVLSPVLTLSDTVDRAALFGHLLTVNAELSGAAFGLSGDQVIIAQERSILDLDRSEVMDLISRISKYADDYDDALVAQFGGSLGGDLR